MGRGALTSSQAAAQLHIHPETLRRWEDRGLITPDRTSGGHRRYSTEAIAQLKQLTGVAVEVCPHCNHDLAAPAFKQGDLVRLAPSAVEPDTEHLQDVVVTVETVDSDGLVLINFGDGEDLTLYAPGELLPVR